MKWLCLMILLLLACNKNPQVKFQNDKVKINHARAIPNANKPHKPCNRQAIKAELVDKINSGRNINIHVFVPLCDNQNQGIVPVPVQLGNGLNASNNLYWGAMYGIKSFFKRDKNWQLVDYNGQLPNSVLERIVFKRTLPSGSTVHLIADAYRGDAMKACLNDFLGSARNEIAYLANNQDFKFYSAADLIVFNGHNGLMDVEMDIKPTSYDYCAKDAMVIACASKTYFNQHFAQSNAYPLLTTTNLLAPEAYVLSAAIEAWINLENGEQIIDRVAKAYNKYQKCGYNGAKNLFSTAW